MKRIVLISMFFSLVLSLSGCTVVKEYYVRQSPRPYASLAHRRHDRPVLPPVHPARPPYGFRQPRDHYGH